VRWKGRHCCRLPLLSAITEGENMWGSFAEMLVIKSSFRMVTFLVLARYYAIINNAVMNEKLLLQFYAHTQRHLVI
jgi:hypothetical protein